MCRARLCSRVVANRLVRLKNEIGKGWREPGEEVGKRRIEGAVPRAEQLSWESGGGRWVGRDSQPQKLVPKPIQPNSAREGKQAALAKMPHPPGKALPALPALLPALR
jgi:hypothetical protein